jgi:hypothetical protein
VFAKQMTEDKNTTDIKEQGRSKFHPANLFLLSNRGLLLDIVVFLLNLFLMRFLLEQFLSVIKAASADDGLAQFTLFAFCVALFVLPPLGATLKRWHFHHRLQMQGKDFKRGEIYLGGCFFNPIFYFCLNVVVFATINAFLMQYFFGNRDPGGPIFVSSILIGLVLTIAHTVLVYRYFSPPKNEPKSAYLRDPRSENAGDACIFLNMICYQLVWNLLTLSPLGHVSSISDLLGRLFLVCFLALLVYFPPRIFYLAEDIHKRRTWITILLANAPIIYRIVIGTGTDLNW